jgi:hypothetical protein
MYLLNCSATETTGRIDGSSWTPHLPYIAWPSTHRSIPSRQAKLVFTSLIPKGTQVVAHLKEKVRSIQQESVILKARLEGLDSAAKERQDQLLEAKSLCGRAELAYKNTMKDFSRVTEPALIREYQVGATPREPTRLLYVLGMYCCRILGCIDVGFWVVLL